MICTGLNWLRIGASGGFFDYGDEQLDSIEDGLFLDLFSDYQVINEGNDPFSWTVRFKLRLVFRRMC
jgi:hypothetical protein